MEIDAKMAPSNEPLSDILSQNGIKEDRLIARSLFHVIDLPLGICDRRRHAPHCIMHAHQPRSRP